uniref:Replication protein A OB domain-containing protein n=1 Tax=Amphimedon queenslandica TaxID=400682 RepID=A0A1X7U717_AMPQE
MLYFVEKIRSNLRQRIVREADTLSKTDKPAVTDENSPSYSISRKRLTFESLSDIKEEGCNAEFYAAMEFLSPIKKSTNGREYYHGKVTDGGSSFRIAGFNSKSRAQLSTISAAKIPVHLTNCEVKKSNYDDALEVIVRPTTEFGPSPRTIEVPVPEKATNKNISEILDAADGVLVNLGCKVIDVAHARVVRTGRLQEVMLADQTGTIKLCCWDEKTLTLRRNSSFTLTTNKDDITTPNFEIKDEDNTDIINDARIIGMQYCNLYWGCIS